MRAAETSELTAELAETFHDVRLRELLPRYKARNYPVALTDAERSTWEAYRYRRFMDGGSESRLAHYMHRLGQLAEKVTEPDERYILEELQLYAESIMPVTDNE